MRLTKSQSIIIALGILGLFFAIGIAFIKTKSTVALSNIKVESINFELDPKEVANKPSAGIIAENKGSAVVLGKFERSETSDDGKLLWEIKADKGRYYPETNTANLEEATIWYHKKSGKKIKLETNKADIELDGNNLKKAFVYSGVKIILNENATIITEEASYDKMANSVNSSKKVEIKNEIMETTGYGLEGNIATQEFMLLNNVTSIIKPRKK